MVWVLCFCCLSSSSFAAKQIELTVSEPSNVARLNWPVTSGVPIRRGELRSDGQCKLLNSRGHELPLQSEVLSRWPDGSVRWILLDFQLSLKASQSKRLTLKYGQGVRRKTSKYPALVTNRPSPSDPIAPVIQTGPLRIVLSADRFRLLDAVWLDKNGDGKYSLDERLTSQQGGGFVLTGTDGKQYRADLSIPVWTIEQHGPMRTCIRFDGKHAARDGSSKFRYIIRLHAFRGLPHVMFDYTFVNDHPGSLMAKIRSIDFVCSSPGKNGRLLLNGSLQRQRQRLFQVDDRKYQIGTKTTTGKGKGWASVASNSGGMAVGVREFWQNWPKSLAVGPSQLRVGLLPKFSSGQYDARPLEEEVKRYFYLRKGVYTFKIGMARTHRLWATFFSGEPAVKKLSEFFEATETPLLAQCTAKYIQSTQSILRFVPANPKRYFGYDAWVDKAFKKHLQDQDKLRENGLLNFGDWYDVKKFGGSWGNQEYDTSHNFFMQYLRTGDRRYFDRARQGADHLMDVDVLHAVNRHIRGLDHHGQPQPGHIWCHSVGHSGGYYEAAKIAAPIWYQRGLLQDSGHVWIGGLCDSYLLTGNRRALDVARMAADRIASEQINGYSDHIRGMGWPLNVLVTAYETTGNEKYLVAARRQWQVLKKNLDARRGWVIMLAYGHCSKRGTRERCRGNVSYMLALTLSALARYHHVTQDPEVLQGLSIGLDQVIRECWDERTKSFHATACKHYMKDHAGNSPPTVLLGSLAFAYAIERTGNKKHRRIFREAFQVAIGQGRAMIKAKHPQAQAGYMSRWMHFTPFGLSGLED